MYINKIILSTILQQVIEIRSRSSPWIARYNEFGIFHVEEFQINV